MGGGTGVGTMTDWGSESDIRYPPPECVTSGCVVQGVHEDGECRVAKGDDELCPSCACASSVARACRHEWHQRAGKFTQITMRDDLWRDYRHYILYADKVEAMERASVGERWPEFWALVTGRRNGKQTMYDAMRRAREAVGPDRLIASWPVTARPNVVKVWEDRDAVDRSFENEVRPRGEESKLGDVSLRSAGWEIKISPRLTEEQWDEFEAVSDEVWDPEKMEFSPRLALIVLRRLFPSHSFRTLLEK